MLKEPSLRRSLNCSREFRDSDSHPTDITFYQTRLIMTAYCRENQILHYGNYLVSQIPEVINKCQNFVFKSHILFACNAAL